MSENNEIFLNKIQDLKTQIHQKIIGQEELINNMLVCLFAGGHMLIEWVPWVAKTLTIDSLSKVLDLHFKRIQFTPDLLPSDLIGSEIFNMWKSTFQTKFWPVFTNFLLADEINRAPSKVQSALLEAMAEKHITIGEKTYNLDDIFVVFATQNPIEQTWTYNLPEAQSDRFLLKTIVDYPTLDQEKQILNNLLQIEHSTLEKVFNHSDIIEIKNIVENIFVSQNIIDYVADIVFCTRDLAKFNLEKLSKYIEYWVSPRWSIALIKSAKAYAFMNKRDFVIPEDIKIMAKYCLAHRLILTYEATLDNITSEKIVEEILTKIEFK